MRHVLYLAALISLAPFPVWAEWESISNILSGTCGMQETVNMNINFRVTGGDPNEAQLRYAAKNSEITALSRQAGVDKLVLSNKNYTLASQEENGATHYSIAGYTSVMVTPPNKADDFLLLLTQKGFIASLNANAYNNGEPGCAIGADNKATAAAPTGGSSVSVDVIFNGAAADLAHIN